MSVFPSASITFFRVFVFSVVFLALAASILSVCLDFTWIRLLSSIVIGFIAFELLNRLHREYVIDERGLTIKHILWSRFVPYTTMALVSRSSASSQRNKALRLNIYTSKGNWVPIYPHSSHAVYEMLQRAIADNTNG